MKKVFLIVFGLMTTMFYAQEQIVPLTQLGELLEEDDVVYYYKDIDGDLTKFLGTWKYQDATKELIVVFYLKTHTESGGTYYDDIYAKFKYTENGTVIYNTLNNISELNKYRIFGVLMYADSRNKLSLAYNEPTDIPYEKYMTPRLKLEYLPCSTLGCNPQLKWDIFWASGKQGDPWPFKIPSHLTLIKQ